MVDSLALSPAGDHVASASSDTTVLVWDTAGIKAKGPATAPALTPAQVSKLMEQLSSDDARVAYRALWELTNEPAKATAYVRENLQAILDQDDSRLPDLVKNLDSGDADTRAAAAKALEGFGESAEGAMAEALKRGPSAEAKKSLESLMERMYSQPPQPETLRRVRALQMLEMIGTEEAEEILDTIARKSPSAFQSNEAKAAVTRIRNLKGKGMK
jgi:hypothetical protein